MYRYGSQHGHIPAFRWKKGKICPSNAEIMIHQPSGGAQGQATEIQIAAEHILRTKKKLNEILAANTGEAAGSDQQDTERDNFMSAEGAKEYGLIDRSNSKPLMGY